MRLTTHLAFVGVLAAIVGGYYWRREGGEVRVAGAAPESSQTRASTLDATNRLGMPGHWYVPPSRSGEPMRVVLAFHGTGQPSASMAEAFVELANRHRFVVVAPQSGVAPDGATTWNVGDHFGDKSLDSGHVEAVLEEVETNLGAKVTKGGWLALGFSGGGSSAPYRATNDRRFSAYAVLHGGVFEGGLGNHRVRGWFSTGRGDTIRSPERVSGDAERARRRLRDPSIVYRDFVGGHLMIPDEVEAVMKFWLEEDPG